MQKRIISLLIVLIILAFPAVSMGKLAPGDFVDVGGHWAEPDIEVVTGLGIMNGMGTNDQGLSVFSPDSLVSRSQLAAVLVRTFQLDCDHITFIKQPEASDYYRDVDDEVWYANDVVMCAINNVFDITDSFSPDTNVSRIEIARAVQRCFDAKGIMVPMIMSMPVYEDTNELSQQDMNAMVFVNNTGIMKGNNGCFRPEEAVKRSELAVVLNRVNRMIGVDESYNGREFSVPVGQTFILSLASNPTTGFGWSFKSAGDEKVLSHVGDMYLSEGNHNKPVPGQGGREYWKFKALKAGTTNLEMVYSRSWESVQPAQTFNLKVIVKPITAETFPLTVSCKAVKNESETMKVDMNIPVVQGMENEKIQSAINAQLEKDAMDLNSELSAAIDAYVKDAEKYDYPIRPYQIATQYQVGYQNEKLLSLYVDYYQYTGGAHGMTARVPYNIELDSAEQVALQDLFQEKYDYQAVINREVRQQIKTNSEVYFSGDMGFTGITDEQNYYMEDGYLVVYFSQYEIAPYSSGIPEFKIPFTQLQVGLKAEFLQ